MKKRFTILAAVFALLAFLAIPMGMRGQTTVTFTAGTDTGETSVTKDGVTVSMSTMSRTDNYRCYANTAMTIVSSVGNITSVELTCTGNGDSNYGPGKFSLTEGYTGSYSYSGNIGTWIGSAADISLSASSQVRMTEIVVTIGGSVPTTYTVTYDCNGGTSGCPENVTGIEIGTQIQLAPAPTKTDYTFDGWNDGSTTYQAGANYTVNGNVTFTAQWTEIVSGDEHWVIANLTELTEDDVFVIVGNNGSNYAMSNNNGTGSAPSAVAVTVTGNEITSTVASTIQWTVSGDATNGYTFYPNGSNDTWLYCTNSNNGVRIGTNTDNIFEMDATSGYLVHQGTSRYIGIYNSQDWRCYTSINNNISGQTFAFYKKMVGGTVPPSISANNVSVEYDAVSGSIAYTVNNAVTGGTMSAAVTEGDWLTLGQGTTSPISFTCTANQTSTARTATVTLTYTYNRETTTANVTVTQAANPNAINNISEITAAGTYTVQGTIVAKSARGFIVGDGTGYVYYYNVNYAQADYNIGDMVKLAGSVIVYGGVYEFNNTTTVTAATSSNYVAEDPTVLTGEQMDARVASTTPPQLSSYVQYEGTLSVNDTHYNITDIVGATTAIGSVSYPLNVDEITALDGKHVKVTGYYVGISSSTYYNTMLGSIEEIASSNPSITAEDVNIEYNATNGAITYTINNPVNGGVLTAATESEWLTLGTVGATVPFTCAANTTASPRTATVTLTYTYNTDQIVTKNVTVTQAGNPNTIDNISDITAAGTYTVQGTIVAKSMRGFIVGDGTGYVYYYNQNYDQAEYEVGDMVKLSGSVVVFGGVFEFNNTTEITYVSESNYVTEEPTVLSGADMDARVASTTPAQLSDFVQYEGMLSVNGTHYNITAIEGATTAQGSISYPIDTDEITAMDGKMVKVTGYYVGISSSTYYNTMLGSIEELAGATPSIAAADVDIEAAATSGAIEYTINNPVEGGVLTANTTADWLTLGTVGNTVPFTCTANEVTAARTAIVTLTYTYDRATVTKDVTVTQAAYVAPFEPATYTLATTIESGKTYIIVGTKTVNDTIRYYAMGEQRSANRGGVAISVDGTTATVDTEDVYEFVITALDENGFYSIYDNRTPGYLYAAGNNANQLKTEAELDVNGHWEITIDSLFSIVASNSNNRNVMQFNYNNNNPTIFSCYATASQAPVYLYVKDEASTTVTQTIALSTNWNWFSTNVEITLDDLKAALLEAMPGATNITIKSQNNGNSTYNGSRWRGTLTTLDVTQMYRIKVEADCEITLTGMPIDPVEHPITIANGANWIGFPFSESMTLTNAFAGFAISGDKVTSQEGLSTYTNRWRGAFSTLEPGKGYIYNSNVQEDRTLVFPTSAK